MFFVKNRNSETAEELGELKQHDVVMKRRRSMARCLFK